MDFFQHQDRARRKTGVLVVLFILAVVGTVVCVNLATVPFIAAKSGTSGAVGGAALVTICVLVTILVGSLVRVAQMSGGGKAVAEALGGTMINPGTADPKERRALNVVEEMAIASGMPVPPVYLLPDPSINAFAAGRNPQDSVIGLTEGCITRLNRDELQGVVGHEFSHILHQDTRLNMRLVCLLGGILAISLVGRTLLRTMRHSRRGKETGGILLIGLAFFIVGSIGYLFGRLIQCAVSRQREFLADASAVQYTRNPDGLAGALEKISRGAGSEISAPRATEFSHFLFASGFSSLFSTHPDVNERISRIRGLQLAADAASAGGAVGGVAAGAAGEPVDARVSGLANANIEAEARAEAEAAKLRRLEWEESGDARPAHPAVPPVLGGAAPAPSLPAALISAPAIREAASNAGTLSPDQLEHASRILATLPGNLVRAAHDPFAARAVILAMLTSSDGAIRGRQIERVRMNDPRLLQTILLTEPAIAALRPNQRLPLLELCAAAMALLSPQQYMEFLSLVSSFIAADNQVDRFEWSVNVLLRRAVERRGAADENALAPTEHEMAIATAVLCYSGARAPNGARRAWQAARAANQELPEELPAQTACTLDALDNALRSLDRGRPSQKRATFAGCIAAVCADGETTTEEAELLRSISDCIGVPMPPIVSA